MSHRVADAFHYGVSTLTAVALSGSLAVVAITPVSADGLELLVSSARHGPIVSAPIVGVLSAAPIGEVPASLAPVLLAPTPGPDVGPPAPSWVTDTIPELVEVGEATWYGDKFHGRLTASGEVMDQEALIAAHPSLPFGTLLRVTNQQNGLSVVVRVVDRGPQAPGKHMPAIVDLSRAAAREIDMIETGRVIVTVEVVEPAGG